MVNVFFLGFHPTFSRLSHRSEVHCFDFVFLLGLWPSLLTLGRVHASITLHSLNRSVRTSAIGTSSIAFGLASVRFGVGSVWRRFGLSKTLE